MTELIGIVPCFFCAILYSNCLNSLSPVVRSHVNNLRIFRDREFAHMPRGKISDLDFKSSISKVYTTFQALGLGSLASKIQTVEHQTGFPTKELNAVLKKVDDLEQELRETKTQLQEKENNLQQKGRELQDKEEQRQVLEDQFNTDVSPFCILPSKPTHDVEPRRKEVAEITQQDRKSVV